MMLEPQVQWVTASPLWNATTNTPGQMQQPALLTFASDTFMQDLASLLQTDPQTLASYRAQPVSYRARPTGADATWEPESEQLKLYQPTHGHFNLIAASLVCRIAGMPDRVVDAANGEKACFVLRKQTSSGEYAWVADPARGKIWQLLTTSGAAKVAVGEELLPMFPVNFTQNDKRRRLLVGLIPTASRETLNAAPNESALIPAPNDPALQNETPLLDELDSRVIGPLTALVTPPAQSPSDPTAIAAQRTREIESSAFLLLDLADFLNTYAATVWQAIYNARPPANGTSARALYDLMSSTVAVSNVTWQAALIRAWNERSRITDTTPGAPTFSYNLRTTSGSFITTLRARVQAVLPAQPPAGTPASSANRPAVPQLAPDAGTQYILRCVYQRPNCGPLQSDLVSQPSEPFAIAPFFDFDAPARPIRISLPIDTSVAGLRKFQKNVSFLVSDNLRKQMECATDLKSVMDGNLACGTTFSLGMICSFSIPIITICALIVLMIFLNLLNIVFWWLPFFRICFPISLKAES